TASSPWPLPRHSNWAPSSTSSTSSSTPCPRPFPWSSPRSTCGPSPVSRTREARDSADGKQERLMNKRTIANLVTFFVVGGLFFFWAATSLVNVSAIKHPYTMKADFANAVGLLPGSEVDYLGVTYGTVSSVERIDGGVRVTMKVDKGKVVPANSSANIFRKSALGEQYIEFDPPEGYTNGGPYYAKNALIPMSRTTVPLEFSELLRSAGRLVSAIPPDAVNTLVHEAAVGVNGRADSFRGLADAGDKLSQMLVQRTAVLDRLATNNTRLTHVF